MAIRSRIMSLQTGMFEGLSFLAPALIRLTVGLVFVRTGWGKLNSLDDVTELFATLQIPLPALNARIAAFTEFAGGILLLLGLGARLAALPLAFTMFVAIVSARLGDLSGFIDLLGLEEWSYLMMFLIIAIRGPGALSLDAWLAHRFAHPRSDAPRAPRPQELETTAA